MPAITSSPLLLLSSLEYNRMSHAMPVIGTRTRTSCTVTAAVRSNGESRAKVGYPFERFQRRSGMCAGASLQAKGVQSSLPLSIEARAIFSRGSGGWSNSSYCSQPAIAHSFPANLLRRETHRRYFSNKITKKTNSVHRWISDNTCDLFRRRIMSYQWAPKKNMRSSDQE